MKKKILILFCLILIFVSVSAVSATDDVNQTVIAETDDFVSDADTLSVSDEDVLAASKGTFTELQDKINNAPEGSTITLQKDYVYNDDFGTVYGMEISKSLTIDGKGHTIDALSDARIFSIYSNNVILKNIKFNNGFSHSPSSRITLFYGGAIYLEGDDCSIINSVFTNNIGRNGGAISIVGSNCNIIDSTFVKNTAVPSFTGNQIGNSYYTYYLGGYGGAIYVEGDGCSVKNSIFTDNKANKTYYESGWGTNMVSGGDGGAIYIEGNNGNISYSNFKNNIAGGSSGGAIYIKGSDSSINYCSYSKEYSYENGIYLDGENNVVKEYSATIDVKDVTKNYGGSEKLVITLTNNTKPIANAKITIKLNGKTSTKTTDSKGKASLDINLNVGSYNATVSYGDVSTTAKVTVNKASTKTSLTYEKTSHDSVTLTATVSPTSTGKVVFNVNGKDKTVNIKDSKAVLTLTDLDVGSYTVKATYKGDTNHKSSSSSKVKFTIEEYSIMVSAPNLVKYYGGNERFVVTVKDSDGNPVANEPVKVTINGQVYDRKTGAEGKTTFAINLNSGTYKAKTVHDGDVITSTITVKSTVKGNDVTKIFRNGTNYEATFYDTKGKKVSAGEKVDININGVFYKRTVKDDGSISFALNLEQGTYILTLTNPETGEKIASTVNVLPNIVENKNLTKYYRNASQFTFKLLDDKGRPAAGQKASININGVFYTRTTNDKGIATFQINLEPGTYILTTEYKGCRVANTVKVLTVLLGNDVNMEYQDGSAYKVKVLDGRGKPAAGVKLKLNINGVFYDRTTKSDGTASLTINLRGGTYTITASYNGLNCANTVKVTVPTKTYTLQKYKFDIPKTCEAEYFNEDGFRGYSIDYDNGAYAEVTVEPVEDSMSELIDFFEYEYSARNVGSHNGWSVLDFSAYENYYPESTRYELFRTNGGYLYGVTSDDLNLCKEIANTFR